MTALLRRPNVDGDPGGGGGHGFAGSVGRRRPLPSGRAVGGAFLVAVAATLVIAAWLSVSGSHGQPWVVARHDLAAGTRLTPGDLTTESMTLPGGADGPGAFRLPQALNGRFLAAAVLGGELIQRGALVPLGQSPGLRPVTFALDAPDASDLASGTAVDVLVTDGTGAQAATSVLLRGAQVLDVSASGSSLLASDSGDDVTLGVRTLAEVEAVVHAAHTGSLTVVVATRSDGAGLGPSSATAPKHPRRTQTKAGATG